MVLSASAGIHDLDRCLEVLETGKPKPTRPDRINPGVIWLAGSAKYPLFRDERGKRAVRHGGPKRTALNRILGMTTFRLPGASLLECLPAGSLLFMTRAILLSEYAIPAFILCPIWPAHVAVDWRFPAILVLHFLGIARMTL